MNDHQPPERPNLIRRAIIQPVSTVADAFVPVIVDAVDLNETLARVDLDEVIDRLDVDALLDRVDVERIVNRVDLNELLKRVDVNELLRQVDVDGIVARVDLDALLERVDIDAIVQRVDVTNLTSRIEVGSLVTRGTGGLLSSFLDLLRRQVVGLDVLVMRIFDRLRRDREHLPTAPRLLARSGVGTGEVSGRFAGPVSRLVAFAADLGIVLGAFALGSALFSFFVQLVSGQHLERSSGIGWTTALLVWAFVYLWAGLSITGKTIGKGIVGLRVVSVDGAPLSQRQALLRVIVFPLSFILLGLGLLLALVNRERRALHDILAKTCEVYDWGERPAEMPGPLAWWLSRRGALDIAEVTYPHPQGPAAVSTH